MKKKYWPYYLVAAFVLAMGIAYGIVYALVLREQNAEKPSASAPTVEQSDSDGYHDLEHPLILTNMNPDSVSAFTLNGYRYVRGDEGFYAENYPDMPLDQAEIRRLLTQFTDLETNYFVEMVDGGAEYGMDVFADPSYVLEDESGEKISVWIGKKCDLDERLYVRSSYVNGVYLVEFDASVLTYADPYYFIMLDPAHFFQPEDLLDVQISDKDGNLLYDLDAIDSIATETWDFLGRISISPSDVQAYRPTEEQLSIWKLDAPLTVKVTFADVYQTDQRERTVTYRLGAVKEGTYSKLVYVQIDRIVYQTPISDAAALILEELAR